jgi:hypothetical protein
MAGSKLSPIVLMAAPSRARTGFMPQFARMPDIEAQRAAMQKLDFLAGNWQGEARLQREPGAAMDLTQSEMAQYKLDGLILLIEGIGRSESEGKIVLQAFATISYDDENGKYLMRAYNDGRYLETEIKLAEDGRGLTWVPFSERSRPVRCCGLRTMARGRNLARLRLVRNRAERFWSLRFGERSKGGLAGRGAIQDVSRPRHSGICGTAAEAELF